MTSKLWHLTSQIILKKEVGTISFPFVLIENEFQVKSIVVNCILFIN